MRSSISFEILGQCGLPVKAHFTQMQATQGSVPGAARKKLLVAFKEYITNQTGIIF